MSEIELKKFKKIICITFSGVLLLVIAGVMIFVNHNNSVSPNITISGIQSATASQENYILAKVEEKYYEISSSNEFSQLFLFKKWKNIKEITQGIDVIISLRFAELFVIDIYENGMIAAYDGYAPREYRSLAYYEMPTSAIESIVTFFEENAIRHELGDGTISNSTFIHD